MKLTSLVMMLLIAFSAAAQEEFFDDVYFSSKNKKKKEQVEEKKLKFNGTIHKDEPLTNIIEKICISLDLKEKQENNDIILY